MKCQQHRLSEIQEQQCDNATTNEIEDKILEGTHDLEIIDEINLEIANILEDIFTARLI